MAKKTKSERKRGPLSSQELTEAEIDWIKAAQRELKCQENYKQLSKKFGLTEDSEDVMRCKGQLEYADLPTEAKEPTILPEYHHLTFSTNSKMSQGSPPLWSEEYSCRTANQILGPQGDTSCEEDAGPVRDMQQVGGNSIYSTSNCEFTRI